MARRDGRCLREFRRPAEIAAPADSRDNALNASGFLSMTDTRDRIELWRKEYNDDRTRTALGGLAPSAFANQASDPRTLA